MFESAEAPAERKVDEFVAICTSPIIHLIQCPQRLHNNWVLQSSPREIEDKELMQNFWGQTKLGGTMGRGRLLPFFLSRAFCFFPHPILPSTTTQRGGSNRTLGAKHFSSAISVTFTFFTPKHPATCEKKPLVLRQETLKGTERAYPIYTLFHR